VAANGRILQFYFAAIKVDREFAFLNVDARHHAEIAVVDVLVGSIPARRHHHPILPSAAVPSTACAGLAAGRSPPAARDKLATCSKLAETASPRSLDCLCVPQFPRGVDAFPAILQALGVPAPHLMGWLTILVEIFGGLAVLLGALVPLASIPMAAVLLVAMFTVHLPYGFSSIKLQAVTAAGAQFGPPGYETDLLYLACLAALILGGSGPLAIDGLLVKAQKR
jgi:putative oxidoreductase